MASDLTIEQLQTAMPRLKRVLSDAEKYIDPLNAAMAEYLINTPTRIAAFLAQIAHESGELDYWREIWGPTAQQKKYEPPSELAMRLGNTVAGDGSRYRGRGPIQITGRANYLRFGIKLDLDLINEPELLEEPEHGFRAAACYWKERGLNELADKNTLEAFKKITKRINGGYNGLDDRLRYWELAKTALNIGAGQ